MPSPNGRTFWDSAQESRTLAPARRFRNGAHHCPNWEDFPHFPAAQAAALVGRRYPTPQVELAFPGKDILIGSSGCERGRMPRWRAAPPPPTQGARRLHEDCPPGPPGGATYKVQSIEAVPISPGKAAARREPVGGYWGPVASRRRNTEICLGRKAISDHPMLRWQAAGGCPSFAVLILRSLAESPRTPSTYRRQATWGRPSPCIAGDAGNSGPA